MNYNIDEVDMQGRRELGPSVGLSSRMDFTWNWQFFIGDVEYIF